jgi:hypothetical protein
MIRFLLDCARALGLFLLVVVVGLMLALALTGIMQAFTWPPQ